MTLRRPCWTSSPLVSFMFHVSNMWKSNLVRTVMSFVRTVVWEHAALWSGTNKNPDVSTGPLTRLFARLLAPLTRLLAPPCSLCSRAPLRSLVCSLVHFAHSLTCRKVNDLMSQNDLVLSHSALPTAEIYQPSSHQCKTLINDNQREINLESKWEKDDRLTVIILKIKFQIWKFRFRFEHLNSNLKV